MLKTFRKHRKSLFGFLIVGLMGLFMVPFGIDLLGNQRTQGTVIKVGDTEVSSLQYYRHVRRLEDLFRARLGANYAKFKSMINLEQQAIDELIDNILMNKLISTLGLSASNGQIEEKISSHPFFNGQVSKQSLDVFVRSQGLTTLKLESDTKDQIIQQQMRSLFTDMNIPTDVELKEAFRDEHRKAEFRYLAFRPSSFEAKVNTEDNEALKEYYTDHSESYRKPRSLSFSFVTFRPLEFQDKVELTEEDIQDAYELRKHSYFDAKQVRLRRILLRKEDETKKSALEEALSLDLQQKKEESLESSPGGNLAKKAQAKSILEQLNAGVPFAELASKHSEDQATKKDGGDMGWMEYKLLEAKLREAASSLEKGAHSEVIETDSGFNIVYVEDKKEKKQQSLETVRAKLEKLLRTEDAPVYARAEADVFLQKWQEKDIPLKDFATEGKRPVVSTEKPLARGEGAPGIPPTLTEKISMFSEGDREIVEIGDASYLVEVSAIKDAYIPDFEEVREEVAEAYRKEQSLILAKQAADKALLELLATNEELESDKNPTDTSEPNETEIKKKNLDQLAAEYALKVESSPSATRATASGPIFVSEEGKRTAFTLSEEKPIASQVLEMGGAYFLVELAGSTAPDESEFESKKEELRNREKLSGGTRLMQTLMKTLRANTEVWVDPELLNKEKS